MRHPVLRLLVIASLLACFPPRVWGTDGAKPTLFLIGDSTVKCGSGNGEGGMFGWGQVLDAHFDLDRIDIKNHAIGGRSSRTFLTEGRWDAVRDELQPGDFVLMQFGHNDGGEMFEGNRPRASIKGNGDDTQEGVVAQTGKRETVHSYGWYLRKYAREARERGATPIVLSLIPRDIWHEGRVARADQHHGKWAAEAAAQVGAIFVDLNDLVAHRYEADGRDVVHVEYFTPTDHTHTSRRGAEVNAECVVTGVIDRVPTLAAYLRRSSDAPPADATTTADLPATTPAPPLPTQRITLTLPEGNYTVRLTRPDDTPLTVYAELRRLMVERSTRATDQFTVNIRTPQIDEQRAVRLKERELTTEAGAWDDKLTLEFVGGLPKTVDVSPADHVITAYILGDSTVADQPKEPWSSWGQILPRFLDAHIAVANHAESGESVRTAMSAGRFDKVFSLIRPGDYLFIQFGHNDMKDEAPDAVSRYRDQLGEAVLEARNRKAHPVLVTSMERKAGIEADTLGDYPDVVRTLAADLEVPLIDLHTMSKELYAGMGTELDRAFVDATHHTTYGSYQLARCVVEGIRKQIPGLARHLRHDFPPIDPANPGSPPALP